MSYGKNQEVIIENLKVAGIISIIYGVISAISNSWEMLVEFGKNNGYKGSISNLPFSLVAIGVYIFIMLKLKELLNKKYNYYESDKFIVLFMIMSGIFYGLEALIDITESEITFENLGGMLFSVAILIFYGVIDILFANSLKRSNIEGYMKVYANIALVEGIVMLTMIFAQVGSIVSSVGFIFLGLIFLQSLESTQERKVEEKVVSTHEVKREFKPTFQEPVFNQKREEINVENRSENIDEEVEKIYTTLTPENYERIKANSTKWVPKDISEKDVEYLMKQYIREGLKNQSKI